MKNMGNFFLRPYIWPFLILVSNACWNNLWCYTEIWVSFKENKDNFFVFYLVKVKVAFKNTIFWCWIWALIHTNQFYNLELTEFKFCDLGLFFQKASITYNLGQNCRDNRKSIFQQKNPSPPKSMLFAKF